MYSSGVQWYISSPSLQRTLSISGRNAFRRVVLPGPDPGSCILMALVLCFPSLPTACIQNTRKDDIYNAAHGSYTRNGLEAKVHRHSELKRMTQTLHKTRHCIQYCSNNRPAGILFGLFSHITSSFINRSSYADSTISESKNETRKM